MYELLIKTILYGFHQQFSLDLDCLFFGFLTYIVSELFLNYIDVMILALHFALFITSCTLLLYS